MTKLIRIAIAALTLSGALALVPGVARADEDDRPPPPVLGHDRDGHGDRDWRRDRDWRQDRAERARWEREHRDHDGRGGDRDDRREHGNGHHSR